jgi:hypothetical protein
MGRLLSIEYPGGLYHVTSSSYRQEAIFEDDQDHYGFLNRCGFIFRSAVRPFGATESESVVGWAID